MLNKKEWKDLTISKSENDSIISCLYNWGFELPKSKDYTFSLTWYGYNNVSYKYCEKECLTLGELSLLFPQLNDLFWENQKDNIEGRRNFYKNCKNLLGKFNIYSVRDILEISDRDLQFSLTNRVGSKEFENSIVSLMYINKLSDDNKAENTLEKKLYFSINNEDSIIPYYENTLGMTAGNYYFTASHRTFFSSTFPDFFKIDVPYKISNSVRNLTRNELRIRASEIIKSELANSENPILKIFDDYAYVRIGKRNMVLRNKFFNGFIAPLFAFFQQRIFDNGKSFFTHFYDLRKNTSQNIPDYLLLNILFPLIDCFEFFLNVSIKYKRLIFPYDFHMQNIMISIYDNQIGFIFQDFDMSKELTVTSFYEQLDFFFEKFVVTNILESINELKLDEKKYIMREMKKIINTKIIIKAESYFGFPSPSEVIFPDFMKQYLRENQNVKERTIKYRSYLR